MDSASSRMKREGTVELQELLVCPACRGPLGWDREITCGACGRSYPLDDGIPVMLFDRAAAEHDELEHLLAEEYKRRQASFFNREDTAEFETVRPHGAPAIYGWLYAERFRRSVIGLEQMLPGSSVLTVCGGSGMDAEFLARSGARVVNSDISLGAAKRARARAGRFGLPITCIVADVEHLPFRDRSINLVYVHEGLHHLERPTFGLREMARVAAQAVSVSEPAQAAVTRFAIRLGLADEREAAGNRVARFAPEEIARGLRRSGFRLVHSERYAMYIRHQPGPFSRLFGRPCVFRGATVVWLLTNIILGRIGNRLAVVALRV